MLTLVKTSAATFRPLSFLYKELLAVPWSAYLFDPLEQIFARPSTFVRLMPVSCFEAGGYPVFPTRESKLAGLAPSQKDIFPSDASPLLDLIRRASGYGSDMGEHPVAHYNLSGSISTIILEDNYRGYQNPQVVPTLGGYVYPLLVSAGSPTYYFKPGLTFDSSAQTASGSKYLAPNGQMIDGPRAHGALDIEKSLQSLSDCPTAQWSTLGGLYAWNLTIQAFEFDHLKDMVPSTTVWKNFLTVSYDHRIGFQDYQNPGSLTIDYTTRYRIQIKKDFDLGYGVHLTMPESGEVSFTSQIRPLLICRIIADRTVNTISKTGRFLSTPASFETQIRTVEQDDVICSEFRPTLYWCDGPIADDSPADESGVPTNVVSFYKGSGSMLSRIALDTPVLLKTNELKSARFGAFVDAYADLTGPQLSNLIESFAELRDAASLLPDLSHFILAFRYLRSRPLMAARELVQALSGGYLYTVFGLVPNVQLVGESQRLAERLTDLPTTGLRGFGFHSTDVLVGDVVYHVQTRCRILLQDNFALGAALSCILRLSNAGLLPSPSSLWDLVPMSFAADWVFHIGQRLAETETALLSAWMPVLNYSITHRITAPAGVPDGYSTITEPMAVSFVRTTRLSPPPPSSIDVGITAPPVTAGALLIALSS